MAVAIVTDSTSDIEPQRAAAAGVEVVPLFVLWGDRSYRDYIDLTRAQFYERLLTEPLLPTTSQPSAHMFEEAFAPHVAAGEPIVCIVLSSKLSGTINAARAAAAAFSGADISIVDSLSVAGGLGMLVMRARALAQSGASAPAIVETIEREKRSQHLYACIPDLSHVVRTGRIGKARAAIGTLMKIVPVISLRDGEVVAEAQVRTLARAQATMIDLAVASVGDPAEARFLVMHTNAAALAATVRDRLLERFGGLRPKALEVLEAGPVIATHGGAGAVGIFAGD